MGQNMRYITLILITHAISVLNYALPQFIEDRSIASKQRKLLSQERKRRKEFAELLHSNFDIQNNDPDSAFSGDVDVLIQVSPGNLSERTKTSLDTASSIKINDELYALSASMDKLRTLSRLSGILSIEIDEIVSIIDEFPKENRRLTELNPDGVKLVLQSDEYPGFWDSVTPQGSIKICVADTGYDLGHPDLPVMDDVIGSNNPGITSEAWSYDGNGHGTHVAGIIAALGGNDEGVRGVIPNNQGGKFQLIIAKAFDKTGHSNESKILSAVETCKTNGANVISLSLGRTTYTSTFANYFQGLHNQGILVVAAAGNRGDDYVSYPASHSSVISVASVGSTLEKSSFSQYNSQIEISAPGELVRSTYKGGYYIKNSGTSMATPHVAAIAGLLWMHFPSCTNEQIRNVIDVTAKTLPLESSEQCNENTGYGFVQAKDAYDLLAQVDCGGFLNTFVHNGGCEQLGKHTITCSSDLECDDNDSCTIDTCQSGMCNFDTNCSACGKASKITIEVKPDNNPDETYWQLSYGNANIMSGGPYPESKVYTSSHCVDLGTYNFTITDKNEDGICCLEGDGYYTVKVDDAVVKDSVRLDTSWESETTIISNGSSSPSTSISPSSLPSISPTFAPSDNHVPTISPSDLPSRKPSFLPSDVMSNEPSAVPSNAPSAKPSEVPSNKPSIFPSNEPSIRLSEVPLNKPSIFPSNVLSNKPSNMPSDKPSSSPFNAPSQNPSSSNVPSDFPSNVSSYQPTTSPSNVPSINHSDDPSEPPSSSPSKQPTCKPSISPSNIPSQKPSPVPSNMPSNFLSNVPSKNLSRAPSDNPSDLPSVITSLFPTSQPTEYPTLLPTQVSTSTSMTGTYQQSYAGNNELNLLSDTEIEIYEANMASHAVNNTNISNAQVTVSNQEITTISNRRRLQEQRILSITYDLRFEYGQIDEIATFLKSHVSNMMQQKDEIKKSMIDQGIQVDDVMNAVEVTSTSKPTSTKLLKTPKPKSKKKKQGKKSQNKKKSKKMKEKKKKKSSKKKEKKKKRRKSSKSKSNKKRQTKRSEK